MSHLQPCLSAYSNIQVVCSYFFILAPTSPFFMVFINLMPYYSHTYSWAYLHPDRMTVLWLERLWRGWYCGTIGKDSVCNSTWFLVHIWGAPFRSRYLGSRGNVPHPQERTKRGSGFRLAWPIRGRQFKSEFKVLEFKVQQFNNSKFFLSESLLLCFCNSAFQMDKIHFLNEIILYMGRSPEARTVFVVWY